MVIIVIEYFDLQLYGGVLEVCDYKSEGIML